MRVCDRTALILDIFAQRAATREGKLQVALAQAEYQLPRLTRMWTHLDRVGGGGQVKGAGERQIELDRRQLRDRMSTLRQRLEGVRKHREQYRSRRREEGVPVLALAGCARSRAPASRRVRRVAPHAGACARAGTRTRASRRC